MGRLLFTPLLSSSWSSCIVSDCRPQICRNRSHTDIVIKLRSLAGDFVRWTIESLKYIFQFKSQLDEELLDLGVLLLQLLLHQDLFLVFHLAVLRDGGVAVELQLVVAVLRLAWLVVSVLFGVVVGKGHLAELLLIGGGDYEANIA